MVQSWNNLPFSGPILRPREASNYIGLSLSKYYALIKEGDLPPLIKLSERASGTPKPWLDEWLASRSDSQSKS